jgi:exopolysaccharide biosynthesis WecB/TagA/CpsF family protein
MVNVVAHHFFEEPIELSEVTEDDMAPLVSRETVGIEMGRGVATNVGLPLTGQPVVVSQTIQLASTAQATWARANNEDPGFVSHAPASFAVGRRGGRSLPLAYSAKVSTDIPTIDIFDLPFRAVDPASALEETERLYERDAPALIAYANVHTVNLAYADSSYAATLRSADLLLNDGKGVMLGARMLGQRFPSDMNGNFFTPFLLELAARRGWSTFILGGKPRVAHRAARRLEQRIAGLKIVGTRDGYFSEDEEAEVIDEVRSTGAQLLLVALGNPKQEMWLHRNLEATGVRLGIGVGRFVDFQAGEIRRAPAWMNRLGLEWVHRLVLEPRRMWRRYLLGNPLFVTRVLRSRFADRRRETA